MNRQTRLASRPGHVAHQTGSNLDQEDLDRTVERLVRVIKRNVGQSTEATGRDGGRVVLDVEVQGLRVLVMRAPPTDRTRLLLSPREFEIARMVARGYPNKTIAGILEISSWTVSTHLRRMFAKLDVTSRAAMVAKLLENGVLAGYTDDADHPSG